MTGLAVAGVWTV
jgi:hypothetical protein